MDTPLILADLPHAPNSTAFMLTGEANALSEGEYLATEIELPDTCEPARTTLWIGRSGSRYYLNFNPRVKYYGANPNLKKLCGRECAFGSRDELADFFRGFPENDQKPTTPLRRDDDPDPFASEVEAITNWSEIFTSSNTGPPELTGENLAAEIRKEIVGQDEAVHVLAALVVQHILKRSTPIPLSIMLAGEPGTGKTATVKTLAKALRKFGHDYDFYYVDANTLSEAHSLSKLVGSPPGYVGYEDEPILEAAATGSKPAIILIDEAEKAHPRLFSILMGVLDEGRIAARKTLADGSHELNFSNHCIIVFTTNAKITGPKKHIGFSGDGDVEEIHLGQDGINVHYHAKKPEVQSHANLMQHALHKSEEMRTALVKTGVMMECASRIGMLLAFQPLSTEAMARVLAKTVVTEAQSFGVRLSYISPNIMQALFDAASGEGALTVRSYRGVIQGNLAWCFAEAGLEDEETFYRLEGTLEAPRLTEIGED